MGYVASVDMSRSWGPAVSSTVMLLMVAAEINTGNVYIIPVRERLLESNLNKCLLKTSFLDLNYMLKFHHRHPYLLINIIFSHQRGEMCQGQELLHCFPIIMVCSRPSYLTVASVRISHICSYPASV